MDQLTVRVARRTIEADGIIGIDLEDAGGSELPPFSAGAHIDVHIENGLVRQYSLCNPPWERNRYQIGVLRDPASRGGSVAVHDRLAVGDFLRISVPRNLFPLVAARRTLLLAGGIGITPLLSMAETLTSSGANFELHYCARTASGCAFRERIGRSKFQRNAHFHFDDGHPLQKLDLHALLAKADRECHIYVCGPGGFIEYVRSVATSNGWPLENIHFEYFGAQPQDTSSDKAFDVKISSTGRVYHVMADQNVVSALACHGIAIPVSCEAGVCGTCVVKVIAGIPDHRDSYLTEEERASNEMFTPCCSRAKTEQLVLAL